MPDVPIRKDSAWRKKFELEFASPDSGRESVTFDAEMERVHRQGYLLPSRCLGLGFILVYRALGSLLLCIFRLKLSKDSCS